MNSSMGWSVRRRDRYQWSLAARTVSFWCGRREIQDTELGCSFVHGQYSGRAVGEGREEMDTDRGGVEVWGARHDGVGEEVLVALGGDRRRLRDRVLGKVVNDVVSDVDVAVRSW